MKVEPRVEQLADGTWRVTVNCPDEETAVLIAGTLAQVVNRLIERAERGGQPEAN